MKPFRFTQQVLALFIAITASTCAFANNHEENDPDWIWHHDFVVDNFAYYIIPNSPVPAVAIIEAYGHSGHIDVPAYVTHNDTTYEVTTLGTGYSGFRDCRAEASATSAWSTRTVR